MDGDSKVDTPSENENSQTPRDEGGTKFHSEPDFAAADTEPIVVSEDSTPRDYVGRNLGDADDAELRDENVALRRRLAENGLGFQERLDHQTGLISRLQDRLKDSQKRIADMETAERNAALAALTISSVGGQAAMSVTSPSFSGAPKTCTPRKINSDSTDDLMLNRLLEEQDRCTTLNEINTSLRRELDEIKVTSVSLTSDLLRVTQEYDRTKRDLSSRIDESKKTEKLYLERLTTEHRQMLKLWRSFQQLRRDYLDCRSMTKRGLNSVESELQRVWKGSAAACQKLNMWMTYAASARALDKNATGIRDSPNVSLVTESSSVEEMILENLRRLTESQNEKEEIIRQLQQRTDELIEQKHLLESQVIERDRQLETFKNSDSKVEEKDDSYAEYLHNALRDLADRVLSQEAKDGGGASSMVSPRRRARSFSPSGLRGRAAAETTVRLVKEALDRRQRDANELLARLRHAQHRLSEMDKSASVGTADRTERERLEKELSDANILVTSLKKERDGAVQQKENLKTQLTYLKNETLDLERKKRESVERELENMNKNMEEAQKRILQLESIRSNLEDERERSEEGAQRHKSDLSKLKLLLDSTQATLNESRDEATSVQSINNRLERENQEVRSDNEALKETVKKLEAKCDALTNEMDRLSSSEVLVHDRAASLTQENQTLTRERDEGVRERQVLEKRLERIEDDFVELERKRDASEIEIKSMSDELDAFRQMETVWNQERTLLLNQFEIRENDLHDFETQVGILKKEHAQTDYQLKAALEKQRDLELQLESCRRDLNNEHEKSSSVFEERQLLMSERDELEQRITTFAEQIRRFELQDKQTEEKYRTRLLELERRLEEADEQKKASENLILDLTRRIEDAQEEKRNADSRSNSLQAVLISQEELIRGKETEKRNVQSRVSQLEAQVRGRETQLKQISEKFENLNSDFEKAVAENRILKSDLDRIYDDRQRFRSEAVGLNGEVQHLRIQLQEASIAAEADKEKLQSLADQLRAEEQRRSRAEADSANTRSALQRAQDSENDLHVQLESAQTLFAQQTSDTQALRDQYISLQQQLRTTEQEKRMIEERLRDAKEQLTKSKRDSKLRSDEISAVESRLAELDQKSIGSDTQLKSLQKMLAISQDTEADLKRQLVNAVGQRQAVQTRLGETQKKLETLESQRREWTAGKAQSDRDLVSLKLKIAQCEEELRKNETALRSAIKEREAIDKSFRNIEKQNSDLQNTVAQLQSQITSMEKAHSQRQCELQRHRAEIDNEMVRLQSEKQDSLRKFELLERTNKRRIKELEEENKRLQNRMSSFARLHQDFVSGAVQKSREAADLRARFSDLNVGLETSLLKNESSFYGGSPLGSPAHTSTPVKKVASTSAASTNMTTPK